MGRVSLRNNSRSSLQVNLDKYRNYSNDEFTVRASVRPSVRASVRPSVRPSARPPVRR